MGRRFSLGHGEAYCAVKKNARYKMSVNKLSPFARTGG